MKSLTLNTEKKYSRVYGPKLIGIDEVGRGCLAGPVFVAGVIFSPNHHPIKGVTDSKQLSENSRTTLAPRIKTEAQWWRVVMVDVEYINNFGIVPAIVEAMNQLTLDIHIDLLLYDGNYKPILQYVPKEKIVTIIKGDSSCYSIAAASILAKVARDEYMCQLAQQFPQYSWEQNKGYGTKVHRNAISIFGPTKHHRKLFIRNVLAELR